MPDIILIKLNFAFYRCRERGNATHARAVESNGVGSAGFTLIETMIVVAIIGILTTIAVPTLITYRTKAKNALAISEIKLLEQEIKLFEIENMRLPDQLNEVKLGNIRDPWGNPYKYLKIAEVYAAGNGNGGGNGNGNGGGNGNGNGGGGGNGNGGNGNGGGGNGNGNGNGGGGNGNGGGGNGNGGNGDDTAAEADENLDDAGTDKRRKDHFQVPVNTDFDLYSMGKDGRSRAPFTAKASRDDIVRVNDGKYIGLASNF